MKSRHPVVHGVWLNFAGIPARRKIVESGFECATWHILTSTTQIRLLNRSLVEMTPKILTSVQRQTGHIYKSFQLFLLKLSKLRITFILLRFCSSNFQWNSWLPSHQRRRSNGNVEVILYADLVYLRKGVRRFVIMWNSWYTYIVSILKLNYISCMW